MRLIETDMFRATAAWMFMLLSAFLLLFSFGDKGEATGLTFFYLILILLLGLFLYVTTALRLRNNSSHNDDSLPDGDSHEDNSENEKNNSLKEFEGADKGVEYFDVERFVSDLMKKNHQDETIANLMERVLSVIVNRIEAVQGILYLRDPGSDILSNVATYAHYSDTPPPPFKIGETLPGQVAKDQKLLNVVNVPEGYMTVLSGLGSSHPRNLIIIPFVHDSETVAVAEIASFKSFTEVEEEFFSHLSLSLGRDMSSLLKAWVKERVL